jgi:hypothetical protein
MHLSRVYRKLGVRSRTELAGRIVTPRDEAAKASHAVGKPVDQAAEV